MLNRTARILAAAARQGDPSDPSCSTASLTAFSRSPENPTSNHPQPSDEQLHNLADLLSSGDESEPYADSGSSYQPSDNEKSSDDNPSEESDEQSSEEDNQLAGPTVNPHPTAINPVTTNDTWGPCGQAINDFPFTVQNDGFQLNPNDFCDPYKVYRQFIDDEVLELIVRETNRYADQYIRGHDLPCRSEIRKWTDTNKKEIRILFGVLLIMGINHLPKMRLYWSQNPMYRNELICKSMKRDRFDLLLKFIHFVDNEQSRGNQDRLVKVRTVLDHIQKNFKNTFTPGKMVVIDETMVPWRGRLVFRQYLPAKSHKYGIKVYKVCTTDAYTYNFKIYCGKNEDLSEHGHTFDVTVKLMEGLLNEGRTLYTDNFYTSVKLAEYLLQNNTYLCGTLRANRKGNAKGKDVCKKKLRKGEVYANENANGVRIYKWLHKRPVIMLSTLPEHMDELIARGKKNRKEEDIKKPQCIIDYNNAKKGVDISDQMSSYYTCLRKTIKWYKKAAFEIILGTAVVNSWVIYKKSTKTKIDMLAFRELLIQELFNDNNEEEIEDEQDVPVVRGKTKSAHKRKKIEGIARKNRKRCISSYDKIQNKEGQRKQEPKLIE